MVSSSWLRRVCIQGIAPWILRSSLAVLRTAVYDYQVGLLAASMSGMFFFLRIQAEREKARRKLQDHQRPSSDVEKGSCCCSIMNKYNFQVILHSDTDPGHTESCLHFLTMTGHP